MARTPFAERRTIERFLATTAKAWRLTRVQAPTQAQKPARMLKQLPVPLPVMAPVQLAVQLSAQSPAQVATRQCVLGARKPAQRITRLPTLPTALNISY